MEQADKPIISPHTLTQTNKQSKQTSRNMDKYRRTNSQTSKHPNSSGNNPYKSVTMNQYLHFYPVKSYTKKI